MAQDKDALHELRSVSKMQEVHVFEHYLYFPLEATSKHIADFLRNNGFVVEDRLGADGANWLILARSEMVPTELNIAQARTFLERVAQDNGGEYDGWETAVRR